MNYQIILDKVNEQPLLQGGGWDQPEFSKPLLYYDGTAYQVVHILYHDMDLFPIGFVATNIDSLETRIMDVDEGIDYFGIPDSALGEPSEADLSTPQEEADDDIIAVFDEILQKEDYNGASYIRYVEKLIARATPHSRALYRFFI